MKQETTLAFDAFASFCEKGITGLSQYGADLEMTHITDVIMQGKVDAARKANGDFQTAVNATLAAKAAQNEVRKEVVRFITATRDVLKLKLGTRYAKAWTEVGFLTATLEVPQAKEKQLGLLKSMELYYTAHPEVEAAVLGLTHQHAKDLHDAYLAAMAAVEAARVTQRQNRVKRDDEFKALRASRQLLFRELRAVLPANDSRWLDFGFNVPGDVHVTDAPDGVKLTRNEAGHLVVSWDRTASADRYRVSKRVVGLDAEYVPQPTTLDTSFDLGVFPSGAHVDVQVTAINSAGESVPSDTASAVVP